MNIESYLSEDFRKQVVDKYLLVLPLVYEELCMALSLSDLNGEGNKLHFL